MNRRFNIVIPVLVFIVLLIPIMVGFKETKTNMQNNKDRIADLAKECQDGTSNLSDDACKHFSNYKVSYMEYHDELNLNTLENTASHILLIATPFIIVTLFGLEVLRNKSIKLKDYKKTIVTLLKKAYSIAWVYPVIVFIKGILAFIGVLKLNSVSIFNIFIPFVDTLLAFMFMGIIINIALMVARFINNPIYYLIGSGLVYTIVAFLIDIVGNIFSHFGLKFGEYINIFNLTLIDTNYLALIIIITLLFASSLMILYKLYKDQKSLINYVKKNA